MNPTKITRASEVSDKITILCLCDSPTLASGFAAVIQNLLKVWTKLPNVEVHVWGIGFIGLGYERFPGVQLFPGGAGGEWHHHNRLTGFLTKLAYGNYTHVWIMQDLDILASSNFGPKLKAICAKKNVRSACYFPIDAPTMPDWVKFLDSVDEAIAYTHFGAKEVQLKAKAINLRIMPSVIPHGVDTEIFKPVLQLEDGTPALEYLKIGKRQVVDGKEQEPEWTNFRDRDSFCLLNVNTNQYRKDPLRSFEILEGLLQLGVPAKLVMHSMPYPGQGSGGINYQLAADKLGLQMGKDWMHTGNLFEAEGNFGLSSLDHNGLNRIYNSADMLLTTTLGEGWGLPIIEALAVGLPVALPRHTSCLEIYQQLCDMGMESRMELLELERGHVMGDNYLRSRVDLDKAIDRIGAYYNSGKWRERPALTPAAKDWLDWENIAITMINKLVGGDRAFGVGQIKKD